MLPHINYKALGVAYGAVADITKQELDDQQRAERAARIAGSEVWQKDFFPMLSRLHDEYLDKVKTRDMSPDTLKVFDDILTAVDGAIQIGANALARMAKRRLKAAEATQKLKVN